MSEQINPAGKDVLEDESIRLVTSLGELEKTLDQGAEHSAHLRAISEPFYLQMDRLVSDEADDLSALYEEFQYAPVITEPTEADIALANRLKAHIEETAECLVDKWDSKELQRITRVFEADGTSHWVYNSRVTMTVPDISQWQLKQVETFRVWWPNIQVMPVVNETGEYVPVNAAEPVIVLPDYEADPDHMAEVIELHNAAAHLAAAEIAEPKAVPQLSHVQGRVAEVALTYAA